MDDITRATGARAARAIHVAETPEALSNMAAEEIIRCSADAIRDRGRFVIALSGGSTPRQLFALLASPAFATRMDWPRIHVCWGDERCVPPDDPQSNFRMAAEALLDHVPIPEANVHRVRGEDAPDTGAAAYESALRTLFNISQTDGSIIPAIDLILLGLGTDGHTASLFPGGTALRERARWVVADYSTAVRMWRITFTLPLINASRRVLFLVAGADKADVVRRIMMAGEAHEVLPAELVAPTNGSAEWILDRAAMSKMPPTS